MTIPKESPLVRAIIEASKKQPGIAEALRREPAPASMTVVEAAKIAARATQAFNSTMARQWFEVLCAKARKNRIKLAHDHALSAYEMAIELHRRGDIHASNVWAHHAKICRATTRSLKGAACTP